MNDNNAFRGGAETGRACGSCGQINFGQTGEHPCPECGLPLVHDAAANHQYSEAPLNATPADSALRLLLDTVRAQTAGYATEEDLDQACRVASEVLTPSTRQERDRGACPRCGTVEQHHMSACGIIADLRAALHDAIRSPMGVVPESATRFHSASPKAGRPTRPGERGLYVDASGHLWDWGESDEEEEEW